MKRPILNISYYSTAIELSCVTCNFESSKGTKILYNNNSIWMWHIQNKRYSYSSTTAASVRIAYWMGENISKSTHLDKVKNLRLKQQKNKLNYKREKQGKELKALIYPNAYRCQDGLQGCSASSLITAKQNYEKTPLTFHYESDNKL